MCRCFQGVMMRWYGRPRAARTLMAVMAWGTVTIRHPPGRRHPNMQSTLLAFVRLIYGTRMQRCPVRSGRRAHLPQKGDHLGALDLVVVDSLGQSARGQVAPLVFSACVGAAR